MTRILDDSIRRMALAAVAVALGAIALGCTAPSEPDGTDGPPPDGYQLVSAAIEDLDDTPHRVAMEVSIDGLFPGEPPVTMRTSGSVDPTNQHMLMTIDYGAMGGIGEMDMILAGDYVYIRSPEYQREFGTEWVSTLALDDRDDYWAQNPIQMLPDLTDTQLSSAGTEIIRGVETTRWQGVIDFSGPADDTVGNESARGTLESLERLLGNSGFRFNEMDVSAWLDADGLLRRLTMAWTMDMTELARELTSVDYEISMEFFDHGQIDAIEAPQEEDVTDITSLLN